MVQYSLEKDFLSFKDVLLRMRKATYLVMYGFNTRTSHVDGPSKYFIKKKF
jgi:hypothetical protein